MATRRQDPPDILGEIFAARAVTAAPAAPAPVLIPLVDIRRDGGTQPRAGLNEDHVADLVLALQNGATLPAIDAMYDGTAYWLYDGFHRVAAHERAGIANVPANIHPGDQADAQWFSYAANKAHGLKRSNDDKRRQVLAALRHPKAPSLSNRQIALHVGVDEATIRNYRAELETTAEIPQSETRTGADGRTINTGRIGKGASTDTPKASAWELERVVRGIPNIQASALRTAARQRKGHWLYDTAASRAETAHPGAWNQTRLIQAMHSVADQMEQAAKLQRPSTTSPEQRQYENAIRAAMDAAAAIQGDVRSILVQPSTAEIPQSTPPAVSNWPHQRPAAPDTSSDLPADLAARGWELRRVGGVGKWYCNNPSGPRATGVFDRPQEAIEAAYGMQVDLVAEAVKAEPEPPAIGISLDDLRVLASVRQVDADPAAIVRGLHRRFEATGQAEGEEKALWLGADVMHTAAKMLAQAGNHLTGYNDDMVAELEAMRERLHELMGEL